MVIWTEKSTKTIDCAAGIEFGKQILDIVAYISGAETVIEFAVRKIIASNAVIDVAEESETLQNDENNQFPLPTILSPSNLSSKENESVVYI